MLFSQRKPKINAPLPGPKAQAMIARDETYTSPSYTRDYPLAVERGEGCWITDVDGNEFLDFTAGIAVCATGHSHPKVVAAITEQAKNLIHMSGTDFFYGPMGDLAERLARTAPWGQDDTRVFFTNSGTESVEAAFKLARYKTGRKRMIAFLGAFHGRTMGSLSLTASKATQVRGFTPLVPGVTHVPYGMETLKALEDSVFTSMCPPDEVAAIIVEPIQGEGGYIVPPPGFLEGLRKVADKHGILLIFDEVQCGMGRTGKLWAHEHWNVKPDILTSAKGIASGMPLGAMIARKGLMDWPPGAHATTFGGNPVACAAALATLDLLESELMENAATVGEYLMEKLRDLQKKYPVIGDVRGKGLMVGAELIGEPSDATGENTDENQGGVSIGRDLFPGRNVARRDAIVQLAFKKGLLLLGCGRSALRFSPPLIVTKDEVDVAMEILEECFAETA
jgi:4-aminobutyrate aminotransferase